MLITYSFICWSDTPVGSAVPIALYFSTCMHVLYFRFQTRWFCTPKKGGKLNDTLALNCGTSIWNIISGVMAVILDASILCCQFHLFQVLICHWGSSGCWRCFWRLACMSTIIPEIAVWMLVLFWCLGLCLPKFVILCSISSKPWPILDYLGGPVN